MRVLIMGLLLGCSTILSYAQESEATRIAREHQPGGLYNPNSSNGSGASTPMWGAIAIDTVNFTTWGYSRTIKGQQSAKSRAIEQCESDGDQCTVVVSFDDGSCGVVASTKKGFMPVIWSAEKGSSKRLVERATLKSCNDKLKAAGITGQKCELWFPSKCI